jgi:dTDP-4-dehydrorhamnose 3,5-epimerase
MEFAATAIPDVILVKPTLHEDERGFVMETFRSNDFAAAGIPDRFVQDNHSFSRKGALRGLHYQIQQPQGKLVRALTGEVFDVAVDLRRRSSTFGQWVGIYLSADNKHQLWIPPGFAHGLYVVSDSADVLYKLTDYYAPSLERTLLWNDEKVAIDWPLVAGAAPIVSPKDAMGAQLDQAELLE